MTYTASSLSPCQNPYLQAYGPDAGSRFSDRSSGSGELGLSFMILAAGVGRRRMTYTASSLSPCQNPYLQAYGPDAGSRFSDRSSGSGELGLSFMILAAGVGRRRMIYTSSYPFARILIFKPMARMQAHDFPTALSGNGVFSGYLTGSSFCFCRSLMTSAITSSMTVSTDLTFSEVDCPDHRSCSVFTS